MVQRIKQISAVFLIPVLLWSGAGFSLSRHYCLGMLEEESFYFEAESCQPEAHYKSESKSNACNLSTINSHKDCCDDEWLIVAQVEVASNDRTEGHSIKPAAKQDLNLGKAHTEGSKLLLNPNYRLLPSERQYLASDSGQTPLLSQYLAEIQTYLI